MDNNYGSLVSSTDYTIILNNNDIQKMLDMHYLEYTSVIINSDKLDAKTLVNLINDARDLKVYLNFGYASPIYEDEEAFRNLGFAFIMFGVLLAIINTLLIISLISFSIMNQKKIISIIRALGGSKKDIQKIYLIESLIISIITWIVSSILVFYGIRFENFKMGETTIPNTVFLEGNFLTFFIISLMTIFLINISIFIPLRKIVKMKPTDAVKELY